MWKIGNVEIKNRIVFAPMAGISNKSYRRIIKLMGAGLIYSEMISNMGIVYNNKKTIDLLSIDETERPVSIQIFGSDTSSFVSAAKYIEEHIHPDIIDINMGCPVPKVAVRSGSGSALLKDPDKIYKIVKSVVDNTNTPITVKIRSGWDDNTINAVDVAKKIENAGASAICIHPRTRAQGYSGHSDWSIIKQVKESVSIPVIGNGDIKTIYDAKKMLDETGCDAVMIGRSSLGNPWLIKECVEFIENNNIIDPPSYEERLDMVLTHFNILKSDTSKSHALLEIRSHALWYIKSLPNNKEYKNKLNQIKSEKELIEIINQYKKEIC